MHWHWGVRERTSRASIWVSCAALLAGCAGNGDGLDENGRPAGEGGSAPLEPTFESIQQHVFTPICTQCHSGAQAPVGLRLDAESSYAMLVNTASGEVPSLRRVQPGNPDASYLVQKIEGTAAVGGRMPLNNPALPQATIDIIKAWIANGAPRASALGNPDELTLHAVSPQPGEKLASPPNELVLEASTELDVTRLIPENVSLVGSGGDGTFEDGNEIAVQVLSIDVRSSSPTVLSIVVGEGAWRPDSYRLRVSGNSAAPIMDLRGRLLDGNADGTSGDDFVMQFDLKGAR